MIFYLYDILFIIVFVFILGIVMEKFFSKFGLISLCMCFVNFAVFADDVIDCEIGAFFSSYDDSKKEFKIDCFTDNLDPAKFDLKSLCPKNSKNALNISFVDQNGKGLFEFGFKIKESKIKDKDGKEVQVKRFVINNCLCKVSLDDKKFKLEKIKNIIQQALELKCCYNNVETGYFNKNVKMFLNKVKLFEKGPWYDVNHLFVNQVIPKAKEVKLKLINFPELKKEKIISNLNK
jgi:hypothetical protein